MRVFLSLRRSFVSSMGLAMWIKGLAARSTKEGRSSGAPALDRMIRTVGRVGLRGSTLTTQAISPLESLTNEPPPWAKEMMEEVLRLRAENDGLREALRGIRTLLDRQIGVLQQGREELERHIGETPGEDGS